MSAELISLRALAIASCLTIACPGCSPLISDLRLAGVTVANEADLPATWEGVRASKQRLLKAALVTSHDLRSDVWEVGFGIEEVVSNCGLTDRSDFSQRFPPVGGIFDAGGDVSDLTKVPPASAAYTYYIVFPIASSSERSFVYDLEKHAFDVCIEFDWISGSADPRYVSNTVRIPADLLRELLDRPHK